MAGLLTSPRPGALLVAGLVVALVAAVVLVRGGVAADPATFASPSASATTAEQESGDDPDDVSVPDVTLASRAFAELTGLSLGGPAGAQSEAAGLRVDATPDVSGCRALRAAPQDAVRGWARGGWLTSVTLARTSEDGTVLPLRAWVGGPTSELLERAATSSAAVEVVVPVARDDLDLLVRVVTVNLAGAELVLSDLGADGGYRWAELRQPVGRRCQLDEDLTRRIGGDGPVVGPDGTVAPGLGIGLGSTLPDLLADGAVRVEDPWGRGPGCAVLPLLEGPEGVSSLVVADDEVVGVGLSAGGVTGPGGAVLSVGDDIARVRAVFPVGVGPRELQGLRDNSGVVVPTDGGRVVVSAARASAVVPDVDVPVEGPDLLVSSLQVSRGC